MAASQPDWLRRFQDYYWLHDILRISLRVPAWVMIWDGDQGIDWRDLSQVLPPLMPYHFEQAFGKEGERNAYYMRSLRRVVESEKPLVGSLFGFEDYFHPMGRLGKGGAVLYLGQFSRSLPSFEDLAASWKQISNRDARVSDPEFSRFISSALKLTVLPPPTLKGLGEYADLFASHLRGELPRSAMEPRLEALRRQAFGPYLPHPVWAYQAIGFDKERPTPWHPGKQLAPWMVEEFGVTRVPTTVMAMLPVMEDALRGRVLARTLQHEAWAWARKLGGLVAEPLGEDGVLFLTSPDPKYSAGLARREMRQKAEAVRAFVSKRFGLRCRIGLGSPVPEGEKLFASYREAVLSLEYAVQVEKDVLFFDEMPRERGGFQYPQLARAAAELVAVFEQGVAEPLKLAMDEYVRLTLEFASGRMELARGQFLAKIFNLIEVIRRRYTLREGELLALSTELSSSLETAPSIAALLERFKDALRRLSFLSVAGTEGTKAIRLESTLAWMRDNLEQPISLASAARHASLSVPGFTRSFRKATGSAFLPYLRNLRVEQAKRLLRGSALSMIEIAPLCGFSSSHHFIRAFKQVTGIPPLEYRRKRDKNY